MAQPRPSLTLILDIDERLDSEELRLEIGRCYAHVCPTLVRTHTPAAPATGAGESEPANIARFLVKMGTRNYLSSDAEGADALWRDVMVRWFENEFYKVGNNLRIFNRRQTEQGNPTLDVSWIEVDLQNGELTCRVHCDNLGGIDEVAATRAICAARRAYNDGTLGETGDIAYVAMPSAASWKAQLAAGAKAHEAHLAEQEAAARAAAQEAAARRAEAERAADEAFLASPELERQEAAADVRAGGNVTSDSPQSEQAAGADAPQTDFELEKPWFDVDYTACEIVGKDGSVTTWNWENATENAA